MSKSSAMNIIINEIDRIRRERGITQTEFAELIGTKQSNVSRLLRGDENPTFERLEEIVASLGCRLKVEIEEPAQV